MWSSRLWSVEDQQSFRVVRCGMMKVILRVLHREGTDK